MDAAAEFKKGVYKFTCGEFDEAKKIFEDLAFGQNFGEAWVYLGALKVLNLESGETTVQQAVECFSRADSLLPERVNQHQALYSEFTLPMIKYFCNKYEDVKSQSSSAKRKTFGSIAFSGLSLLLGSQAKKSGSKLLGAVGGVYGAYSAQQNRQEAGDMQQLVEFYKKIIVQLVASVTMYCHENKNVYLEFQNKIKELKSLNSSLAPLLESGMKFI